jgi:hypothetical protein
MIAGYRSLDLDDISPQITQKHAAERACQLVTNFKNGDSI